MTAPNRLHPDLQLLAISLEENRSHLTTLSLRRSQSCSGQVPASTERRECRMGRCPEPATRDATRPLGASVAVRESPECRERSAASDQPRSGQGAARGSSTKRIVTDGGQVRRDSSSVYHSRVSPPSIIETSNGYRYVRCRRGGNDDTVYIHQLCAIAAGADPHDVFGDQYDVHHIVPSDWLGPFAETDNGKPYLNTPDTVVLVPVWEHRRGHLEQLNEKGDSQ